MTSGGGAGGQAADVLYIDVQARTDEQSLRQMEQQVAQAGATAGEQGGQGIKGAMGGALASLPGIAVAAAAAVGAALVAGVTAATNFAAQARQGVKELGAELGVSGAEAERLGEVAKKVFGNNWGSDLKGAQEAVANVRREVKGLSDTDLQAVTEGSLAIADRFQEDQAKVAAAVQSLMKGTGISATEATDFIAAGFQKGLNSSGDFLDTLNEYAPQFEKAKIGGDELFSLLETGAAKGALGTDKVADAFKEFGLTLVDVNDGSKAVYAELGLNQQDIVDKINAGTLTQAQAFTLVTEKLKGVQGQANQTRIAATIFGGAGEDFGPGLTQLDTTKTKLSDLKGSAAQVKDSYNTLGSVFQTAGRQILLQLQPIGDLVLDLANEVMPTAQAAIQRVGPVVSQMVRFIVDGFAQGRKVAGEFAPTIQQGIGVVLPVVQSLGSVVQAVFGLIRTLWENVLRPTFVAILPVVTTIFGGVGQIIKTAMDTVTNIVNAVAALFRGDFKGALDFLGKAIETAFVGLQNTLDGAVPKLLQQGKNLGIKLIEGFRSGLTGLGAFLLTALADAVDRASQGAPAVMQRLFGAVSAAARNEAGQLTQQSAEARANVAAASGYQGAGPRLDSTPNLNIPEEAGKFGYAYISKLKDVFVNDPKVASDCAVIASAILHNLGIKIEGSANAGTLEKNALKAGFQPVAGDEIKPGDLIVWTSGNGKTYGAVSGKHVGVAAGYVNGKLQVIENPGSKNTQVNTIYDQQNAVAYRAPGSPFAQTAPVPKPNPAPAPDSGKPSPAPVTVPIKPEITAKDISTELSAKLAGIQARLQLKLIGPAEAIRQLKAVEDSAIAAGRKGGDGMAGYAQAAQSARSVIDSLKKGTVETVDVLGKLQTQYDYAGKTGLPAYVSGLQAYIAQQDKAAQSAADGSQKQLTAMANVSRARKLLEETQGATQLGLTPADVARFRSGAEEVVKLEKGLTTSTDLQWRRRAENRIAEYNAQGQTAQSVLALVKGTDAVAAQLAEQGKARTAEATRNAEAAAQQADQLAARSARSATEAAQIRGASLRSARDEAVRAAGEDLGKVLALQQAYAPRIEAAAREEALASLRARKLGNQQQRESDEAAARLTIKDQAALNVRLSEIRAAWTDENQNAYGVYYSALTKAATESATVVEGAAVRVADAGTKAADALRAQAAAVDAARYKLSADLVRYSYGQGEDGLGAALAGYGAADPSDVLGSLAELERRAPQTAKLIREAYGAEIEQLEFFTAAAASAAEEASLARIAAIQTATQADQDAADDAAVSVESLRAQVRELIALGRDPRKSGFTDWLDELVTKGGKAGEAAAIVKKGIEGIITAAQLAASAPEPLDSVVGALGPRPAKPTTPDPATLPRRTDRETVTPSTVTPARGLGDVQQQRRDEAAGLAQVARETEAYRLSLTRLTIAQLEETAATEASNGRTEQAAIARDVLRQRSEAAAEAGQVLVGAQEALRAALEETDAPYARQIEALEALRGKPGIITSELDKLIDRFKELQARDLRLEATIVVNGVDTGLKALDLYKTGIQGVGDLIQGVFSDLVSGSETSVQGILANMAKMALGIVKQVAVAIVAYQAQAIALALLKGGAFDFVGAGVALAAAAAVAGIAAGLSARLDAANAPTVPTPSTGTTTRTSTTSGTTTSSPGNAQVSIPTSQVTVMATPEFVSAMGKHVDRFGVIVDNLTQRGVRADVRVTADATPARGNSLEYELGMG